MYISAQPSQREGTDFVVSTLCLSPGSWPDIFVHTLRQWPMVGFEQVERRDSVASVKREGNKLIFNSA